MMDAVSLAIQKACGKLFSDQTLWIAFSGGVDSHVLLHAIHQNKAHFPKLNIKAIHVNHQLQPEANAWVDHCEATCQKLNINFVSLEVDASPGKGQSPEDAARKARYEAIANVMETGDVLVTAHHKTDQAETLLLQLMRGSGLAGLAGMPASRVYQRYTLLRPLLDLSRKDLVNYAEHHQLQWIEDPSNQELAIRRNYIRHNVLPTLEQQWPNAVNLVAQSANHLADTLNLLNECLKDYLDLVLISPDVLSLEALEGFSRSKQFHIIRFWYQFLGLSQPGQDKLSIILDEIIHAREDATPRLRWQDSQLIRSKNRLILLPDWEDIKGTQHFELNEETLTTKYWSLALKPAGLGLDIKIGDYIGAVNVNNQTKKLKVLYKEKGLPVALRQTIPQLYVDDQLVLIPGIWQSDDCPITDYNFDFNRFGPASKHRYSLMSILIT